MFWRNYDKPISLPLCFQAAASKVVEGVALVQA